MNGILIKVTPSVSQLARLLPNRSQAELAAAIAAGFKLASDGDGAFLFWWPGHWKEAMKLHEEYLAGL